MRMSRRSFIKNNLAASAMAATTNLAMGSVKGKSVKAAKFGFLKEHEHIDQIYEIRADYRRFDQVNLLFSNVNPFSPRANDPKDANFEERRGFGKVSVCMLPRPTGWQTYFARQRRPISLLKGFFKTWRATRYHFPRRWPRFSGTMKSSLRPSREKAARGGSADYAFENAGWASDHFGARLSEGGVSGHFKHFVDGEIRDGLLTWKRPKWPIRYTLEEHGKPPRW